MELICSSHEATSSRVNQVQEICRRNEISVNVRQCKGIEDVKKLEVDVNKCCVLILDDELVDLLECCGKLVAKILRITSKPNKFIYFKLVTDEKMEMFAADECDWRNCVDSEEELIQVYIRKICKSPTEFDETTNTCQAMQSLRFDSADHLSNSSFLNETVVNQPTKITHARPEAVESIHTFSSVDDNLDEKQCQNDLKRPSVEKGVHKARSEQNLGFSVSLPENKRNNIEHKGERKSLPDNLQSVTTNNLYPQLSGITSYVEAGMSYSNEQPRGTLQSHCHLQSHSHLQSPNLNRPLHPWSLNGHSFDSSGPYALPCQSGRGYSCRCGSCQTLHQQSSSFPQFHTLQPKSIAGSSTGRPDTTNNMNFRPEILAINRNYTPTYDPNIQTDGSDNRTFSCGHCGHSVIPKHEMSDVGPSSETYHSAGGASGMTEKEYMNPDKVSVMELKETVMVMIRDTLDCSNYYNWKKLADLHKWSFGRIYQLEQKWKSRKIDSPFMHLIEEFQHYTLLDLKEDLKQIPRKDLLHKIEELQCRGMLFHN
ncbi:uncharacterized protein LOC127738882 [Mytilus californianus]|uniref:uncharacterized protein LOC127738882 n=1 Tax=Mytilus californianus TaxID=6549 RepID=UPI002245A4B6|nr:uncharacterized protein LOC127738882 [Mytilus californianus]